MNIGLPELLLILVGVLVLLAVLALPVVLVVVIVRMSRRQPGLPPYQGPLSPG